MSDFRTVCKVAEVTEGEGKTVELDKKLIAIFLHQGQWYAIDDCCPHMGASLAGGFVENGVVTCPWHAWRFQMADGAWADYKKIKIGCYNVRVAGDEVQIQTAAPGGASS
jgi:nitrite reductase (NADH) small subunit/3-phenylpropionate/trans-cinnamate dioxygenase ferredoxin subunit